jgi:hypothetical protein
MANDEVGLARSLAAGFHQQIHLVFQSRDQRVFGRFVIVAPDNRKGELGLHSPNRARFWKSELNHWRIVTGKTVRPDGEASQVRWGKKWGKVPHRVQPIST